MFRDRGNLAIAHCFLKDMSLDKEEDFLNACADFTSKGEVNKEFGSGEVFLDLTLLAEPKKALRQLERQVVPYFGRQLFSSIAQNKLVARAATLRQKDSLYQHKRGPFEVQKGEAAQFLAPLPIKYLWLADAALLRQLYLLGIKTIGQLAAIPEEELKRSFGMAGLNLALWSRGHDNERMKNQIPCFITYQLKRGKEEPPERQERALWLVAEYLSTAQKEKRKWGKCLELIWLERGEVRHKVSREFQTPRLTASELLNPLRQLLFSSLPGGSTVVVKLGPLADLAGQQLGLFWSDRPTADYERLMSVVKRLQERYPGCVYVGTEQQVTRREKMLAFYDPCR